MTLLKEEDPIYFKIYVLFNAIPDSIVERAEDVDNNLRLFDFRTHNIEPSFNVFMSKLKQVFMMMRIEVVRYIGEGVFEHQVSIVVDTSLFNQVYGDLN